MNNTNDIKNFVEENFVKFGVNKKQEMVRLFYEITKREKMDVGDIFLGGPVDVKVFGDWKSYLMKRRFPNLSEEQKNFRTVLSELDIDDSLNIDVNSPRIIKPKHIVVEKNVLKTELVSRMKQLFPDAEWTEIDLYKNYVGKKKFDAKDYNDRLDTFYLVEEKYDFLKPCPCSHKSVSCGYQVINLGSGCAFDCSYCYLQGYINSPGISIPANLEDFFEAFKGYKQNVRIGSGEFTDSLVFDHMTGFSPRIVSFFKDYPGSIFEFKTKSDNIDGLLSVTPGDNIVVGWSINPKTIVESSEFFTASLEQRLVAAEKCVKAGYRVVFHFDPVIYYEGWEVDYKHLVEHIFSRIDKDRIAWMSLGTLRMTTGLKKMIESRFQNNTILDEEFQVGYDGKLRYGFKMRNHIYSSMKSWIEALAPNLPIYLCMEEKDLCGSCEVAPVKKYKKTAMV